MSADLSQPRPREDWEITVSGEGENRLYQLKASCVSSPQRYQLLALLLLLFTLIKPQMVTFVLGICIAGWSSRRLKLSVSSTEGVELSLMILLPYQKVFQNLS